MLHGVVRLTVNLGRANAAVHAVRRIPSMLVSHAAIRFQLALFWSTNFSLYARVRVTAM